MLPFFDEVSEPGPRPRWWRALPSAFGLFVAVPAASAVLVAAGLTVGAAASGYGHGQEHARAELAAIAPAGVVDASWTPPGCGSESCATLTARVPATDVAAALAQAATRGYRSLTQGCDPAGSSSVSVCLLESSAAQLTLEPAYDADGQSDPGWVLIRIHPFKP